VWRTEALCLSRGIISADRSANHRFDHNCGHDSLSEHPFPNRGARAPNQGYGLAGLPAQADWLSRGTRELLSTRTISGYAVLLRSIQ